METEKRFVRIDDHTYRMVEPPGIKIAWDFDYEITGEHDGVFDLVLTPRPGVIAMRLDREAISALDAARENFFLENGAVRFVDTFRKNRAG